MKYPGMTNTTKLVNVTGSLDGGIQYVFLHFFFVTSAFAPLRISQPYQCLRTATNWVASNNRNIPSSVLEIRTEG